MEMILNESLNNEKDASFLFPYYSKNREALFCEAMSGEYANTIFKLNKSGNMGLVKQISDLKPQQIT